MEEIVYLPDYFKPVIFDDLKRIGNPNDGGYVVRKQDIIDSEHLISIGISFDWSFEKEFFKNNKKIKISTYDGSTGFKYFFKSCRVRLKNFIKKPNFNNFHRLIQRLKLTLDFCIFFKLNISNKINHTEKFVSNHTEMFKEFEYNYGYKPDFVKFSDIFIKSPKNVFLSIDIESSEYELLDELSEYSDNLVGLNIEFHNVDKNLDKIKRFIEKFKLHLIHAHVNNFGEISNGLPTVIELSFSKHRNDDKTLNYRSDKELPLGIDELNNENGKDYIVKFK